MYVINVCRDVGERQAANLAAKYKTMKRLQLAANNTAVAAATAASTSSAAASSSSSTVTSSRRSRRSAVSTASNEPSDNASTAVAAAANVATSDPEISGQMGASLAAWFADAHNKLLLNELREAGVEVCQEDPQAADVVSDDGKSHSNIDVPGSIVGKFCSTGLQAGFGQGSSCVTCFVVVV
jgi:NAD-dependent DNA ligase